MCGKKSNPYDDISPPPPPPPPSPPYPGYNTGYGYSENKGQPPPYTLTNIHSTPYGASAAHIPAQFHPEAKSGIFNVWGIQGYTGSIDTSANLTPQQTACHLAKIQQGMTGYNQFDPFKFLQTATATNDSDSDSSDKRDNGDDIPKPPDPPEADLKPPQENYSSYNYYPAYPGYGFNHGVVPPPCPPDSPKDKKDKKKDKKCKHCKGASGHPVKKIKKLDYELLCWACVWRAYASAAEEVWKESEAVDGRDGDGDDDE